MMFMGCLGQRWRAYYLLEIGSKGTRKPTVSSAENLEDASIYPFAKAKKVRHGSRRDTFTSGPKTSNESE